MSTEGIYTCLTFMIVFLKGRRLSSQLIQPDVNVSDKRIKFKPWDNSNSAPGFGISLTEIVREKVLLHRRIQSFSCFPAVTLDFLPDFDHQYSLFMYHLLEIVSPGLWILGKVTKLWKRFLKSSDDLKLSGWFSCNIQFRSRISSEVYATAFGSQTKNRDNRDFN